MEGKGIMQETTSGPSTRFMCIHTLANRFEGDLLLDALKKEGIPTYLRTFEETAYDGLFVCQRGWGWIMVPEELSSQALDIIKLLLDNAEAKTVYVNPEEVDPMLWERLKKANPETICRDALVGYDSALAAYIVPFLNAEFLCFPEQQSIRLHTGCSFTTPDFQFYLVVLHYLLEARAIQLSGRWISEREIPGGELFFRGIHRLPIESLTALFGHRASVFKTVAAKMGCMPAKIGDFAFQFPVLPRIPVVLALWQADDEFEPVMLIRFDSTISSQLQNPDTIWAMANVFSEGLQVCAKGLKE